LLPDLPKKIPQPHFLAFRDRAFELNSLVIDHARSRAAITFPNAEAVPNYSLTVTAASRWLNALVGPRSSSESQTHISELDAF